MIKWLGQHIYDLVSRFRNDVYLDDVSTGTIASGGNLGLDSNNKIVKAAEASGDITSVSLGTDAVGLAVTSGDVNWTIAGGNAISTAGSGGDTITINHDDTSSQASVNNSGTTVIQDVVLDTYGHVTGLTSIGLEIPEPIEYVFSTGLDNSSGTVTVDVSDFMSNGINNRLLTAASADSMNAETNLTFDGSTLTVTSGTSGDARIIISADTDNNNENDAPQLWFKADGDITEGAIQHKDNTLDFISNVSANGGMRFLTGTTNNTGTTDPSTGATERMSISSAGVVAVAGSLTAGSVTSGGAISAASFNTEGTIIGKQIQIISANFKDNNTTDETFIPLSAQPEERTSFSNEQSLLLMPTGGLVKEIIVRTHHAEPAVENIVIKIYRRPLNKKVNGNTQIGSNITIVAPTQNGTDTNNTRSTGDLGSAYEYTKWDMLGISMTWSSSGPQEDTDKTYVTVVLENNLADLGYE